MTPTPRIRPVQESILNNRLLLIVNDAATGERIKKFAEGVGFEAAVSGSPQAFVKAARFWHPSVLILGLQIEGTDGIALLRALAADQCPAHVVVSGSDRKLLETAVRLGSQRGLSMAGILELPLRLGALRKMLGGLGGLTRGSLVADLAEAIERDQLYLEYQPKFDRHSARFAGVEALARWRHPRYGLIRPDDFVKLAEETGLIHKLTDWVVAASAQQAGVWRSDDLRLDMAVNISARDIEDLDLPERLHRHCKEAGIDPGGIILELTETGAMREAVQMMDVLSRLRLKGFRLSIDDFGTGYSSLVQLQRLPFSEIKIDQSFVMNMTTNRGSRVIVEIIIELARRLGLKSVAEGIEDEATLKALIKMGCHTAQGYHLSRPIPASEIPPFLSAHEVRHVHPAA